ncbi:DUF5060 domain-containing protein [Fontivita pretiosa]|uniref:DUF5060 domain-containing protein n=1 Tax=Fontivita pretiosa TaxID=2989684 RepID=UPI003D16FF4E
MNRSATAASAATSATATSAVMGSGATAAAGASGVAGSAGTANAVEQWDIFEIELHGPSEGNPFVDVELTARFTHEPSGRSIRVHGFYDGGGIYRVRFMPTEQGHWSYLTRSNRRALDGRSGGLLCTRPSANNHGPVQVHETFHFRYADGTAYKQVGTTCYAWVHQGEKLETQTLATLKSGPFNKIRMCIFPKRYAFNQNEPELYPFEGTPPNQWDFTRFNPAFWQHLELRVRQLRDMNIEADLILFHPYDGGHWGFDRMDPASDDRYLKYVVARLAAFRNVWWSMANEFDFMKTKTDADWDRFFRIVQENDPYGHLRSIHNGKRIYDHNKPWVTHASIQNGSAVDDFGRAVLYRDVYYKPIVFDEVEYEGNIPQRWGDLSPEQMVHAFWQGTIGGTYVGHGETYLNDEEVLWWSKGGTLRGQSPPRLAFLRRILEESPSSGIDPIDKWYDVRTAGKAGEYYLIYFGREQPGEWLFELPKAGLVEGMRFRVEIIDTWEMTITPVPGEFRIVADGRYRYHAAGRPTVKLPGKPYIALRIIRVGQSPDSRSPEKISELAEEMNA